jgi:membrane associated rhomboid family serine protease/Zn-finger nucleic acid-binding protein
MDVVRHEGVELDHCRNCGGTFLDPGEGGQLFGAAMWDESWIASESTVQLGQVDLLCPNDSRPMNRLEISDGREMIRVETCETCGGVWLDSGEGIMLREALLRAGQDLHRRPESQKGLRGVTTYLFQLLSGFPLEVWNPVRNFPAATVSLLASLTFIFMLQILLPEWVGERLLLAMAMFPEEIRQGTALWTLITSTFLHINLLHLASNLFFLYTFGDNVEEALGSTRFFIVYGAAALAGSLLQALLQPVPAWPVIGASGAVSGLLGAYLILFRHIKLYQVLMFIRVRMNVLVYAALWFGFNLILATDPETNVGVFAHMGGFLMGLALGWMYRLRPLSERFATPSPDQP